MQRYAGIILLGAVMVAAAVYSLQVTPTDAPEPPRAGTNGGDTPSPTKSASAPAKVPQGSGFDFYVLSLSWSPSFCLSEAGSGNRQQCGDGVDYGLVVHGLWPQYDRGFPADCESSEPPRVPEQLGRTMLDIMPGMGLIGHQWRKHGTCSGLSQADYFRVTRAAFERIKVPQPFLAAPGETKMQVADVERQFIAANPGLKPEAVAVTCEGDRLEEIRICMAKDLSFRPCPEVDRRSCRMSSVSVPAIR